MFIKRNILFILALIFFLFLFFYRLDYTHLENWDEAWYASIAREIVRTGDFIHLSWNGTPFFDHPPLGFWITAISYKFFGISEFTTRLPSAIFGILSMFFLYILGMELFKNKTISLVSILILGTSVWYVIRVRSGNLDSLLIFCYVATMYFALKSSKNIKYFPLTMISFALLILSKTLVGMSALVLIGFMNFENIIAIKKNYKYILIGILLFFIVTLPWYISNFIAYPNFIQHHFFEIGLRQKSISSFFTLHIKSVFFYIHNGISKWYYPWLIASGYLILCLKFKKKNVLFIILWCLIVLFPFLTSDKTEIWHLLPVYLPLSLITAKGMYELFFIKKISLGKFDINLGLYILFFLFLTAFQLKTYYSTFIPSGRNNSDEISISKIAGKYNKTIYLNAEFIPTAVYYSGKNVQILAFSPDSRERLISLLQSPTKDYVVITTGDTVKDLKSGEIGFKILNQSGNSYLITAK